MPSGEKVFGVKIELFLRRHCRSKEGTAQKSGFQLHDVQWDKKKHPALDEDVALEGSLIHHIYTRTSIT
jgi:hypothetical protein